MLFDPKHSHETELLDRQQVLDHLVTNHGVNPRSYSDSGSGEVVAAHRLLHEEVRERAAWDHPSHYGGKDNPHEAIKCIHAHELDFDLGNAVKYIFRAGKKDSTKTIEDLRKAIWYIESEIALVQSAPAE